MSLMSNQQDWPDELDALNAAPQYHALLFENEAVRVLDTRVPPGQMVPPHTHRWQAFFTSSAGVISCAEMTKQRLLWRTVV
jgi:quercetin dioxygenase-like cupin family protein